MKKMYFCIKCNHKHRTTGVDGINHIQFDEDHYITKSQWKKMSQAEANEHRKDIEKRRNKAIKMREDEIRRKEAEQKLIEKRNIVMEGRQIYIDKVRQKMRNTKANKHITLYQTTYTDYGVYLVVPEKDIYKVDLFRKDFISKISKDNPLLKANGKSKPGYYLIIKNPKSDVGIKIYFYGIVKSKK